MATKEQIKQVIEAFHSNFHTEGFVAFSQVCQANFQGAILLNYKGLRIIRFKKSQLTKEQFDQADFHATCAQILLSDDQRETLFKALKDKYKLCMLCVIAGDIQISTGELASFQKGNVTAYIY